MAKDDLTPDDDRKSIRCRYCGQRNQTQDKKNGEVRCGRCRLLLSDEPHKKFPHLDKNQYVHPADSRALAALRAIPGIDSALKKLLAVTGESAIRVIFTASAVKVTPNQCPDLYAKLQVACTTLGVDMPELFVQQSPVVNAFTGGVERPVIVLYSQLLERLMMKKCWRSQSRVGHIHAEHVLSDGRAFDRVRPRAFSIPLAFIVKVIDAFDERRCCVARRAELSCDRAAPLVTQDAKCHGRTMMKMAGGIRVKVDYEQFLVQARSSKDL